MKNHLSLAAIALLVVVLGPAAIAAPWQPGAERVEGVVTSIALDLHRVTIRNSAGKTYEFEASEETLKDLKVGDSIEAKRRPETR